MLRRLRPEPVVRRMSAKPAPSSLNRFPRRGRLAPPCRPTSRILGAVCQEIVMRLTHLLAPAVGCGLFLSPSVRGDELPSEARKLLEEYEKKAAEVRKKIEAELEKERQKLVEDLKKLQDEYTKKAMLDEAVAIRDRIRAMKAGT